MDDAACEGPAAPPPSTAIARLGSPSDQARPRRSDPARAAYSTTLHDTSSCCHAARVVSMAPSGAAGRRDSLRASPAIQAPQRPHSRPRRDLPCQAKAGSAKAAPRYARWPWRPCHAQLPPSCERGGRPRANNCLRVKLALCDERAGGSGACRIPPPSLQAAALRVVQIGSFARAPQPAPEWERPSPTSWRTASVANETTDFASRSTSVSSRALMQS